MKKVTCGTIITDGEMLLLGHVTKQKHWDIPKGMKEEHETEIEAARRELFEETGIEVNTTDLIPLGRKSYNKEKDLSLFLLVSKTKYDIKKLKCSTYVHLEGREPFPEIDSFKYMTWNEAVERTAKSMSERLKEIKNEIARLE